MNDNVSPLWSHDAAPGHGPDMADDFSNFLDFNDPFGLSSPFGSSGPNGPVGDMMVMDTDFSMDGHGPTGEHMGNDASNDNQSTLMDIHFDELQKSIQHNIEQAMLDRRRQRRTVHNPRRGGMVPPTPSSMEMRGGIPSGAVHNVHSQVMADRYSMQQEEPMVFTPLVSPAVTPLDTQFVHNIPEFAMPGAFSPLTSPALDAHQHRSHMPNPHLPQGFPQPPVDFPPSPAVSRKSSHTRRKSVTTRNPARAVRESPSMKAQRKRGHQSMNAAKIANAVSQVQPRTPPTPEDSRYNGSTHSAPAPQAMSREASSNDSVSPEPLPEVLMAPPPPPPPRALKPQPSQDDVSRPRNAPVTPASLMRLPTTNTRSEDIPPVSMDTSEYLNRSVEVASASNDRPRENSEEMTPTMRAGSKTPSLTPSLKPSNSNSAATSRHTSPQNMNGVKKSGISRKRSSVNSSPALVPKISPSIKPLLPQGLSADASALLLASKSNYQNIVEGNHSHLGLQYPEHLSTNLTSKRTSHKIAEQGRRNRINNALAEMASLLPSHPGGGGSSDGGGNGGSAREQTSKASTVELAIDYIKLLRNELEDTKRMLQEAESRLNTGQSTEGGGVDEAGMAAISIDNCRPGRNRDEHASAGTAN